MLLYAVTDRAWTGEQTLYEQVEAALKGGVTCVQLREKVLDEAAFLQEAKDICALCRRYHVPFIVNDNVDIAIACGADGIHVGQEDMVAGEVRRRVGDAMILGVSVHTVEEARQAARDGADYLGLGAVFPTSTKTDADQMTGETLRDICSAVDVPIVAIGGINRDNLLNLAGSGVDGVALVSAIFSAEDIEKTCQELRTLAEKMAKGMRICGAIFDVDGTLLDSMSIWDTIGETYLRSIGYEPREDLNDTFKNMSLRQAARYYQTEYGVTLSIEEIMDGVNAMLERFYRFEVPLKAGVKELLAQLQGSGVKLCIATATDRYLVEAALERCGVLPCFGEIFTCNEVGHGKDEPEIFEAALHFLGTKKAETVVFDDALYAVKAAKSAGFPVAAVYDSHEKNQEEIRTLSDLYLKFDEVFLNSGTTFRFSGWEFQAANWGHHFLLLYKK